MQNNKAADGGCFCAACLLFVLISKFFIGGGLPLSDRSNHQKYGETDRNLDRGSYNVKNCVTQIKTRFGIKINK